MRTRNKIWVGIGAFVVAGTGAVGASGPAPQSPHAPNINVSHTPLAELLSRTSIPQSPSQGFVIAQHAKHGGEGGENEGGEKGSAQSCRRICRSRSRSRRCAVISWSATSSSRKANGRPRCRISCIRSKRLYGGIRKQLKDYKTPPFEAALKVLSNVVKRKKAGDDYDKALKAVEDALAAADAGTESKREELAGLHHGDRRSSF